MVSRVITFADNLRSNLNFLRPELKSGRTDKPVQCLMLKKVKDVYSSSWNLRATERHLPYGITRVTCHPTQVSAPRLNPSHAGRYSIYLPRKDGRLS